MKNKKIYIKPKIKSKKIKLSFFLSRIAALDQFSFIGNIYAQSGCAGDSVGGCTGSDQCGNPECSSA